MKVLIGCEESQVVTKAFRDRGHEAFSCDLKATRGNPYWHYFGDVMECLASVPDKYYDRIILHPDCTAMALSGNKHYAKGKPWHDKRLASVEWTV